MPHESEVDKVRAFVRRYAGAELLSTSAELVHSSDLLYNVTGSTEDPRAVEGHVGVSWKQLLNRFDGFSAASCYVTDPVPEEPSSHPQFLVGGHMTPDSSGQVEIGGVSYLMPLCKWHNSTARDGTPFEHEETRMLKLMGFMEGDTPLTFAARLTGGDAQVLLYFDPRRDTWDSRALPASDVRGAQPLAKSVLRDEREYAVLVRHGTRFRIVESHVVSR